MANYLSLTKKTRLFRCQACNEIIDTASEKCPFCSTAIDPMAAEAAADFHEKINKACSDASSIKITAQTILPMMGISFIPFLGIVGAVGCAFLVCAVPAMTARWWLKVIDIQRNAPNDSAILKAKRTVKIGLVIWLLLVAPALFLVFITVGPLIF